MLIVLVFRVVVVLWTPGLDYSETLQCFRGMCRVTVQTRPFHLLSELFTPGR